jgi:hypothetical protein
MGKPCISFASERWADAWRDAEALVAAHYAEVSGADEPAVAVVPSIYTEADDLGRMAVFTVRLAGELIGYAWFFTYQDPHHGGELVATADALYLRPECRVGQTGADLIRYCWGELLARGVRSVAIGVRPLRDFGPVLHRLGFAPAETTWVRRAA